MSHISIFANGDFSTTDYSKVHDDFIIAADGGARHCLKLGITPQLVIGDFDSLSKDEIAALKSDGAELIDHPSHKDETDLELVINFAVKLGPTEISLYGLLGGRWDMTFANMMLLASPKYAGIKFQIINGNTTTFILRNDEILKIESLPGTIVSVVPINGPVKGLSYRGLEWPLDNATLQFSTPRGVSNMMTGTKAQITLQDGVLLVFVIGKLHFSEINP